MKKLLKIFFGLVIFLLVLMGVSFCLTAYEYAQLKSNTSDLSRMESYITDICSPKVKMSGQQSSCNNEILKLYLPCFSPLLGDTQRSVCFQNAAFGINEKFRSELLLENKKPAEVITWASHAASAVIDFDYNNFNEKMGKARKYFTSEGWGSFNKALQDADLVEATKNRKLRVHLKVLTDPEIKKVTVKYGIFTWYLECPVEIDFTSDEGISPAPIDTSLLLVVEHSEDPKNPDGLGIRQWVTIDHGFFD